MHTPMTTIPRLLVHSGTPLHDPKEYLQLVGSLQYLAFTRPDVSYVVNRLSSICTHQQWIIGMQLSKLFATWQEQQTMAFIYNEVTPSHFMNYLMQIRQKTQMILSPQMDTLSTLANIQSHGHPRNIIQ